MSITNVKEQMSSLFDELLVKAQEQAKEEGRREALAQFLQSVQALSDEVSAMIEQAEASLAPEEEEGEQEGVTLSTRAVEALDFLLDRKHVTVKDLETHLGCSNAAANLALNELSKSGQAIKTFEQGRAIFRPTKLARAA